MATLEVRNRMSAIELKAAHGQIDIVKNPKTGKIFFACGNIVGYVSPKVQELAEKQEAKLENLAYCECSKEGSDTWVPMLTLKGTSNILQSL